MDPVSLPVYSVRNAATIFRSNLSAHFTVRYFAVTVQVYVHYPRFTAPRHFIKLNSCRALLFVGTEIAQTRPAASCYGWFIFQALAMQILVTSVEVVLMLRGMFVVPCHIFSYLQTFIIVSSPSPLCTQQTHQIRRCCTPGHRVRRNGNMRILHGSRTRV